MDFNVHDLAVLISGHQHLSVRDKVSYLNFIADLQHPYSIHNISRMRMLQLSLEHFLSPPKPVTLQLLSPHFSLHIDRDKSSPGIITFNIKPLEEKDHYNADLMAIVSRTVETIKKANVLCSIILNTGFGDAEVVWYHPFEMLMSIKYLHDSGGYTVRDFEGVKKLCHMAKVLGF